MYKKKLGVRVITAITVGALLSSNMSVAMANTQIASLEDNLDEETAEEESSVEEEETETTDETVDETETEETEESDSEEEATEEEESTVETETETEETVEEETPVEETEEDTDEEEAPAEEETDAEEETPAEEETVEEEPAEEETEETEEEETTETVVEETAEAVKPVNKAPVKPAPKVAEEPEQKTVKFQVVDEEGNIVGQTGDHFVTVKDGNFKYAEFADVVPEGYEMVVTGDCAYKEDQIVLVVVRKTEEESEQKIVKFQVVDEEGNIVGQTGDHFVTVKDGNFNYAEFADVVPEGYEMVVTGDCAYKEDQIVLIVVRKMSEEPTEDIIMNIQFYEDTEDNVIAGGDYFVPAGIQNYTVLDKYAPEGYKIAVSGDFFAEEGATLKVRVEKIQPTIINVTFVDAQGNNVGGGDYFVDADGDGIFNYSELDVPEGYKLVVTGDAFVSDFAGKSTELKVVRDGAAIINVTFVDAQGNNVGGGDYFVDEDGDGIFNFSELDVPEGYKLVVTGDAFVSDFAGKSTELKVVRDGATIINVTFVDEEGNNVGGGDYFVDEDGDGIFNFSELDVPEGYELVVTGDAFVSDFEGKSTELTVEKTEEEPEVETKTITINYVNGDGETVGTQTIEVPVGDNNINTSKLTVPEGYELTWVGDLAIGEDNVVTAYVKDAADEPTDPDDPDNPDNPDPEDPDNPDNPDNPDPDQPVNPNPGGGSGGGSSSGGSGGGGGGSSTGSHALKSGEWILDDIGWWYKYTDNTYAKAGWYSLVWRGNTDWYYFNEAGYLISGWFEENGNRYFLHDVHDGTFGRMYTGWNKVEGQWYFFNDNADNGTVGALVEGAQVPAELLNQ